MTLPLRSCSNCDKWFTLGAVDKDSGTIEGLCRVTSENKRGGEKCSAWQKKQPKPVYDKLDWCFG